MSMLAKLNGVCVFLAVVLVLGYLVARPHIGTVYTEYMYGGPGRPPGSVTRTTTDPFVSRAECEREVKSLNDPIVALEVAQKRVIGLFYRCKTETRLLWGW